MESIENVHINLDHIEKGLELIIDAKVKYSLFNVKDALEQGEAQHQLVEGCTYDYELTNNKFSLSSSNNIVRPIKRNKHIGTITPNIYVGTLHLQVFKEEHNVGEVLVEVQSVKADYRDDYRDMLEFITEKCTDLLLFANSPVSHNFETDNDTDNESLYQRFVFLKSIIATDEFAESVHRIVSAPVTKWKETTEQKDIRNIGRFSNANIKELVSGKNRTALPEGHYLRQYKLQSLPSKISAIQKIDTVDTSENRFVKFALEYFLQFTSDIHKKAKENSRLWRESHLMEKELESYLHHSIFRDISQPDTLSLNSPVLQRKEGYREVLRVWLMFDLAIKLVWKGGEDVYKGGKKDIAVLYEYWLFFKLLDLFKSLFNIESKAISELIQQTKNGLNLSLKQGKNIALEGVFDIGNRKLNVCFSYNRKFKNINTYPTAGSWTTAMRPDYTVSFWPYGIDADIAEKEELIVHIHFDAKYKIDNLIGVLNNKSEEETKKEAEVDRKVKNVDLLKMHAYKDAIRRTAGAYVLYPGNDPVNKRGFHEVIPGLGAFPVSPSKTDDGIGDLKGFILEVIEHFVNRASQREKLAFRTFDIFKKSPDESNEVNEILPENYGENRGLLPDETYVLIGYCREDQLDWIEKNGLYNARAGDKQGSLPLGIGEVSAKYLLLHAKGEARRASKLFKIVEIGPRVFSKETLIKKGYPEPSQPYYLVYKIEKVSEDEFQNTQWDITHLSKYKLGRGSALPFSVTLSELMNVKVK